MSECGDCYWYRIENIPITCGCGECRRNPPTAIYNGRMDPYPMGKYPVVGECNPACGKFYHKNTTFVYSFTNKTDRGNTKDKIKENQDKSELIKSIADLLFIYVPCNKVPQSFIDHVNENMRKYGACGEIIIGSYIESMSSVFIDNKGE